MNCRDECKSEEVEDCGKGIRFEDKIGVEEGFISIIGVDESCILVSSWFRIGFCLNRVWFESSLGFEHKSDR